jgi:O-antigen/teichoic acid export membrane protein
MFIKHDSNSSVVREFWKNFSLKVPQFFDFLLNSKSWKQGLIKNAFWLSLADGIAKVLRVVTVVLMVRFLGPIEYGKFAFAFSFVTMFSIMYDFGLLWVATREFSADQKTQQFLPELLMIKILLGIVTLIAIAVASVWVIKELMIRVMAIVLGLYLFTLELVSLAYAIFRAWQKMEYETIAKVTQGVLLFVGIVIVLWLNPSALSVCYIHLGAGALFIAIIFGLFQYWGWQLALRLRWGFLRQWFKVTLPLGLAEILIALYMNIDSVMLGYLQRFAEVGWYNAAVKTIQGFVLIPITYSALASFPMFTAMSVNGDPEFRKRWDIWTGWMIILGSYLTMTVIATADQVVVLVYGQNFEPTISALKILSLASMMMYLYMPYYHAMIIFKKYSQFFWCHFVGAFVNVLMNVLLIPRYGLYGAAWTSVVTHLVILVILFFFAARYTQLKPVNETSISTILGSVISGVLAYIVMMVIKDNMWHSIPLGTIVFVGSLFGLKKIKEKVWIGRYNLLM